MTDYGPAIQELFGQGQTSAQADVATSLTDSPDDAARTLELSRVTGIPPDLIYGDLDNFEQQNRGAMASEIVRQSPRLQAYINSNPLAAKVSNDDWGQLGKIVDMFDKFASPATELGKALASTQAAHHAVEAGEEAFGEEPLVYTPPPAPLDQGRLAFALSQGLYRPLEQIIGTGISGAMRGSAAATMATAAIVGDVGKRLGFTQAPQTANSVAQALMDPGFYASIPPIEGVPVGEAISTIMQGLHNRFSPGAKLSLEQVRAYNAAADQVTDAIDKSRPYLERGEMPPVGLHPLIDQLHAATADTDAKDLQELLAEAQKSSTKARSPEMFANALRNHFGGAEPVIGIDAEAVQKLYGNKIPEVDDGILGWITDIKEQLGLARDTGGDVEVPLKDWLANVDPKVAKELAPDIRARRGGMTLNEAQEAKKPIELAAPEEMEEGLEPLAAEEPRPLPIESVRQSSGLNPSFAQNSRVMRELEMEKLAPEGSEQEGRVRIGNTIVPTSHAFTVNDIIPKLDLDRANFLHPGTKALAKFFSAKVREIAGKTPVRVITQEDMGKLFPQHPDVPGVYYHKHIFLVKEMIDGSMPKWITSHVILHEAAHAATVEALHNFPELKGLMNRLMKETDEHLTKVNPKLRKQLDYAFKNEFEFIAESWSRPEFQDILAQTPLSDALVKAFDLKGRNRTLWDAFREAVKQVWKKLLGNVPDDSSMDAMFRISDVLEEANKILEGMNWAEPAAAEKISEEEKPLFEKARSIGMPAKNFKLYQQHIAEEEKADAEAQRAYGEKQAKLRQTKEWKDTLSQMRDEAEPEIRQRPDIAADLLLREGELHGEKIKRASAKLNSKALTPDQRKTIPQDYLSDTGVDPDDMAGLFGFQSGDQLVAALGNLQKEREVAGLTPAMHLRLLVDAEAERRTRREFGGSLEENILREAEDHVISKTNLDRIHQELLALAQQAGHSGAIAEADTKRWVLDRFDEVKVGQHSSKKYLAQAGKAEREMEQALLEKRPTDAFKAKQEQYRNLLLAKEASALERRKGKFATFARRYSKREIGGIAPRFTNWIHDILIRTGNGVRRSIQDLEDAISRERHTTLKEFVAAENTKDPDIAGEDENAPDDFGDIMPVAPFLIDPNYKRSIDEMTPPEFRAVFDSVQTIAKRGRDENKVIIGGERQDLAAFVKSLINQITTALPKEKSYGQGYSDRGAQHLARTAWASLVQLETIFRRFDELDPKGIFTKSIVEPIFEASNDAATLEREFSRKYNALPEFKKSEMKKLVTNTVYPDPLYDYRQKPMTRGNLLAILQNMGNPQNFDKLVRGVIEPTKDGKVDPKELAQLKDNIWNWVIANTTKADWDRAQKLGDLFEEVFEHSARMYHSLTGVAPERIRLSPIVTPHGVYQGWYHPIIYDPLRPGSSKKLMGKDPLEDGAYYRAATPAGYTKRRTGYAAPMLLNFEAVPLRMKQMINDIAMRPTITQMSKIFYNKDFRMTITKHYNKEATDLLIPYLRDLAGQKQYRDATAVAGIRFLENMRQNMMAVLIGANPGTVLKHAPTAMMLSIKEVGAPDFLNELFHLLSHNDETGERNWNFAMHGGMVDGERWNGSEELQRRHRNWVETITGAHMEQFGENTLRNTIIKLGATPVALSDLISAVPTWLAAYKQRMRLGEDHGAAVRFADAAVRHAHGSTAIAARSRLMRGGPLAQLAAPFYTFFSTMLQRQYELAWQSKKMLGQFSEGEYREGLKNLPNIMGGLWAYVLFPALVEQAVSPIMTKNKSTTENMAMWLARTASSSFPILRDAVDAYLGGHDPSVGIYGEGAQAFVSMANDLDKGKLAFSKAQAGKTIRDANTAIGIATGMTNAQVGRTGEFVYNYATGQEHPKGAMDVARGLWHGTLKGPR